MAGYPDINVSEQNPGFLKDWMSFGPFAGMFGQHAPDTYDILNKAGPMLKYYLEPYIGQGQQAYGMYTQGINPMATDPTGYINKIMGQYKPSEQYQTAKDEALRTAEHTAAAGGMRGTPMDIASQTSLVNKLLSGDMQDWLKNVMGAQQYGLEGEKGIYGMGYGASRDLASALAAILGSQASLAQREKEQGQSLFGNIAGGLFGALGG